MKRTTKRYLHIALVFVLALSLVSPLTATAQSTADQALSQATKDGFIYPLRPATSADAGMASLANEGASDGLNYLTRGFGAVTGNTFTTTEILPANFYFITQDAVNYVDGSLQPVEHEMPDGTLKTYLCKVKVLSSANLQNSDLPGNSIVFIDAGSDPANPFTYNASSVSFNRDGLKVVGCRGGDSNSSTRPVITSQNIISVNSPCVVMENLTLDAQNKTFLSGNVSGFVSYKTYGSFVMLWDNSTGGGGLVDTSPHLVFNNINIRNVGKASDPTDTTVPELSNIPLLLDGLNRHDAGGNQLYTKTNRYITNVTIEDSCYPTQNGSGVAIVRSSGVGLSTSATPNPIYLDNLTVNTKSGASAINLSTSDVQSSALYYSRFDKPSHIYFAGLDISGAGLNQQAITVQEYRAHNNSFSPKFDDIAVPASTGLTYAAFRTTSGTRYSQPGIKFFTKAAFEGNVDACKPDALYAYRNLKTGDFIVRDGYTISMNTQIQAINTVLNSLVTGNLYTDIPKAATDEANILMVSANQHADSLNDSEIGAFTVPAFTRGQLLNLIAVQDFTDDYTVAPATRSKVPYRNDAQILLNCNASGANKATLYNFDFAKNVDYTLHEALYGIGESGHPSTEATPTQAGYTAQTPRVTNTAPLNDGSRGEGSFANCEFRGLIETVGITEKGAQGGINGVDNIDLRANDTYDLRGVDVLTGYLSPDVAGSSVEADDKTPAIQWVSSDTSVATVDANGVVTIGSTPGTATITAVVSDAYNQGEIKFASDAVNLNVPAKCTIYRYTRDSATASYALHDSEESYAFLNDVLSALNVSGIAGYTFDYADRLSVVVSANSANNEISLYYTKTPGGGEVTPPDGPDETTETVPPTKKPGAGAGTGDDGIMWAGTVVALAAVFVAIGASKVSRKDAMQA